MPLSSCISSRQYTIFIISEDINSPEALNWKIAFAVVVVWVLVYTSDQWNCLFWKGKLVSNSVCVYIYIYIFTYIYAVHFSQFKHYSKA